MDEVIQNEKPITREEELDELQQLSANFRIALLRHRAARLALFYRLQFSKLSRQDESEDSIMSDINISQSIGEDIPGSISNHPLYISMNERVNALLNDIPEAFSAVEKGKLTHRIFVKLLSHMRKIDILVDRFYAGVHASLSDVDTLTGLLNRSAMERDLECAAERFKQTGKPLCIAMVDADHFKKVNDTYGHAFGDIVLQTIANRMEDSLRLRDQVYRYGGEEFLVLLPDTDISLAVKVMDRLRQTVSSKAIKDHNNKTILTVSIGITELKKSDHLQEAKERADEALYKAKESGRNCVISNP
ncbi:GGDEF domain-containing protein [Aeromonas dhakensis]|uniref:GGDEF domain-containing protein n=1 Tax=Aeromonas dhakensis TaxID=196024 RepID=UPI00398597E9